MKFNKLVRDRIPRIIRDSGKNCTVRVLSEEEYIQSLEQKLSEELAEYLQSRETEELADLLEVFYALLDARKIPMEELERIRLEKKEARGGFRDRLLLVETTEN